MKGVRRPPFGQGTDRSPEFDRSTKIANDNTQAGQNTQNALLMKKKGSNKTTDCNTEY